MQLRVTLAQALVPGVRLIRLASADGQPLPAFEPGSHLVLAFSPGADLLERKYSLVSPCEGGAYYEIAVKKNPNGRGGSAYLHDHLDVGALLEASSPVSEFNLVAEASRHVLIAGGIGITPMLGMLERLRSEGRSHELHYSAKSRAGMAFADRLAHDGDDAVTLYFSESDSFRRIDVEHLLATHADSPTTHFHVCGPSRLIDRVRLAAQSHGIAARRVHFESFGPAWTMTDGPVSLVLSESGLQLDVPVGTTLLDAMETAGAWLASDCRRGECGACITTYTGGQPIHRDNCLSEDERRHAFCPCVSWAASSEPLILQA